MEAVTALGAYNHTKGGHVISWDDHAMIELPAGATVLVPAGAKHMSFAPVGPNETRYLLRQFCHASVFRWVHKRGHSDREFETYASERELAIWEKVRGNRGRTGLDMFTRLRDVYA
ncbi:hypothetical protein B0H14DRAFT_2421890 [Mycena olivaceomarginata]|nr:hypothetical protein B0H14DRAFT_2421890 [Mycena olivaceomarginata]